MALTKLAARDLLKKVAFPGDNDATYLIAVSGKVERRAMLLLGNNDSCVAAAVEVQRIWRGYRIRSKLRAVLGWRHRKPSHNVAEHPREVGKKKALLCPNVMAQYQDYLRWCVRQDIQLHSTAVLSFEDYSARIIQTWWRKLARMVQERADGKPDKDVKVYRFYRDLISFRARGNPALMLRCINPAEAQLLDKAAGVHIRFRLGGVNFPPNIYYKLFTSRPVVDLCACSPRDYTAMAHRQKLPKDIHNKGAQEQDINQGRDGWYKRWENNGWRLVSERVFASRFQDPITAETASVKKEFHHLKPRRREDVERRRKHRKIEWLKEMYHEGTLQAKENLSEATTAAVNVAADHLVELTDSHGSDAVGEEDVDELLRWTNGLNYDEYITEWCLSASSASAKEPIQPLPSDSDPYEIAFRTT